MYLYDRLIASFAPTRSVTASGRGVRTGDGAPRAYERARFTTFFDPEFEEIGGAAMGVAEWRNRDFQ